MVVINVSTTNYLDFKLIIYKFYIILLIIKITLNINKFLIYKIVSNLVNIITNYFLSLN